MSYNLYQQKIRLAALDQEFYGEVPSADITIENLNASCQDRVKITTKITNNVVTEIKFTGAGCILSQGSTSLLLKHCLGKNLSEIDNLTMENFLEILSIEKETRRIDCLLLGWNILIPALKMYKPNS